ncbi:MAG: TetR/AcrR family transcriptional regulator [Candidatus Acidiferrales bacterium]
MPTDALVAFEPRKTPIQARSTVTVESICEATIQVLLSHGLERLTTTRVAERAGVSVGTLYQYYPNKQSLLFAVVENHLNRVTARVEAARESACHQPLAEMIKEMVEAFVEAKLERPDISVALYRVAGDLGGPALVKRAGQRSRKAVGAMLQTVTDIKFPPDKFAVDIMLAAMAGAMRSLLEAGPSPATVRKSREQLVLLCQSYMAAATAKRV